MKRETIKTLVFNHAAHGYELICLDEPYMFLGDLSGNLPIMPENVPLGDQLLIAGESRVIQFGDETGAAYRTMFKLYPGNSILYLGVFRGADGKMLIFQHLRNGRPREFRRNLFGEISGKPYFNLFVCFNLLEHADFTELHITTRGLAARVFKPVVVFADVSGDGK